MPDFEWTDADVTLATKLAGERYSAQQIADALRGATRNAVIGKLRRLGVPLLSGLKRGEVFWSAPRDAELRRLWLSSVAAADIAKKMGLKDIAAVSGRARYLNLPRRATGKPPAKLRAPDLARKNSPAVAIETVGRFEGDTSAVSCVGNPPPGGASSSRGNDSLRVVTGGESAAVHVLEARPGHCRFPLWPDYARIPLEQKFFCGETAGTSIYCAHHAARCAGIGTASERRAMGQAA